MPPLGGQEPPLPAGARRFGDISATRSAIFQSALSAARSLQPVSNPRFTLQLGDIDYEGPDKFGPKEHKQAVLSRGTIARKLRGTWTLADATGAPVAQRRSTLADIPYLTDNGTFVIRGNEYGMAHQLRLRPGVFARGKANGELESHVNVAKGHGHKFSLDPQTGAFRLHIGQAQIPVLPLLRAQGISDDVLRKELGDKLYSANLKGSDATAMNKLYERLIGDRGTATTPGARAAAVAKLFSEMTIDPEISRRTLGEPFTSLGPDTSLAIMRKLLKVNRGEAESDDRDAAPYQSLFGPEDLFAERLGRGSHLMRQLLWKATAKGNLDRIPPGAYNHAVQGAMLSSGLAAPLEEINPGEILDHLTRVTRMGEGGIESSDAIPAESRSVQPSQLGFVDFLRTPESTKVGVDARLARGAVKGVDGKIYTKVRNARTGQVEYKTPQDLADEALAFPEQMKGNEPFIKVLRNGKFDNVPRDQVAYELPHMEDTFNQLANLVPFKSGMAGQRVSMASRMITQALPLDKPDAPLVRMATPENKDRSFEEEYAPYMGARRAEVHGRVDKVDDDGITIRTKDGKVEVPLYNNFPYARKTFLHHTATVKPGEFVKPGDLLAKSNFTDDKGHMGLGRNVRVAYWAWGGRNFEDAIVMSQTAAEKKFASQHMYQHDYEYTPESRKGKSAFESSFPGLYEKKILDQFSPDGTVKPGTVVQHGDPLILGVEERPSNRKSLLRGRSSNFVNVSQTWDHETPGVVTDVVNTEKGASVVVKAVMPSQVGDKFAGRHGDKGVLSYIIPDEHMPVDKDGKPFDVLLNPQGGMSRSNPAQYAEGALGKIAERTGKPYIVQDFKDIDDIRTYADKELQKHGLSSTERVYDPLGKRHLDDIQTANRWLMKLQHTGESKAQGRGLGAYTSDMTPSKGGFGGAKRIGGLETSALLSGGATNFLRDAGLVRGQANPMFWQQHMAGFSPPVPKVSHLYQKFVAYLKGAGINAVRENFRTHIMPMTDSAVKEMTGDRAIQNAETVNWKDMSPIKGGLFDETTTGGHATSDGGGNRWAHIPLEEPMPNPVMEEPIRKILGITKQKFMDILAGDESLDGERGPKAISKALDKLDLPHELEKVRAAIKGTKKTARDAAIKKFGVLKSAELMGIHPREWMLSRIPVLPPAFRPVSIMGGAKKLPLVDDANYLYKEAFEASQNLKAAKEQLGDHVGDERRNLYNAFKAVTGLGDPIGAKTQERQVQGILKHVFGSSPKWGFMQRRLLSSQVDRVGRAVIVPDPDLDIDQVGIPEQTAWSAYAPDIVRRLVRRGMSRLAAVQAVDKRSDTARQALQEQMASGVVVINRAPTLHRYGMMAARPRLTKGSVMRLPPFIVGPFGADFDGDAMQFHIPATDDEARDAEEKLLPSKNLLSAADFKPLYKPGHEYVAGLYEASARRDDRKPERMFHRIADALAAWRDGEINVDQRLAIQQH